MEKFKEILLEVWREACRNIEITESLPMIAKMLLPRIPLTQILIRKIDCQELEVSTMAHGINSSYEHYYKSRKCRRDDIEQIHQWHRKKEIIYRSHNSLQDVLKLILPCKNECDFMIGPLEQQGDSLPILILINEDHHKFNSLHIEMMKILLEPFTIAVENDARLREITKLREAAEADKKTLLAKLSRKEIGDFIVGENSGLQSVMERVDLVAISDIPVLIFGETGTGKELISRTIHNKSRRVDGPFIRVNCGAIPSELIDSQLFGHERGAFTGAVETRKGWFERADGGTLFLDEVGEMPLEAQVRLLRILQDGWLERVGGKHPIKVDVRIILATHRDLTSMVAQGKFREDLWYRISTFPMFLPPLRERLQDLKMLTEHFAERSAIRFSLPVIMPTESDIELLSTYNWPGNIRELGTVIDRAVLLGNGHCLEIAKSLGWTDSFGKTPAREAQSGQISPVSNNLPKSLALDEIIKNHIEFILKKTRGKIEGRKGAAALLEVNPHTLRARMRKLAIDWARFREE